MSLLPLPDTHLRFPCVEVPQGPRVTLYLGALSFGDLWPLCTVSPRQPREDDPLYSSERHPSEQTPQRAAKDDRLREIAEFVEERLRPSNRQRKEAIFPGSIILGLLTDVESGPSATDSPSPCSAVIHALEANGVEIWLPRAEKVLFIIDGQHRLKGLNALRLRFDKDISRLESLGARSTSDDLSKLTEVKKLREDLLSLKVPISLLVDFDLAEQAMVFATVNFKQKTVSRSFYYDIFGAFESDSVTPISFTHDLVLHLNNSEISPLKGMIKLLGTGPGLVSQAFLVAKLTLLVDPNCPKAVFRDFLVRRQSDDKEASRQLAGIIRTFFTAVHEEMQYAWPQIVDGKYSPMRYPFILMKSMAISGLLATLGDLYRLVLLDFAFGSEKHVAAAEILTEFFWRPFLSGFDPMGRSNPENSVFARGKEWSIGGSTIIERRIYDQMRHWIFGAYFRDARNENSPYSQAIARFNGPGRARALLNGLGDNDHIEFWAQTERQWLTLVGPPRI